MSMLYAHASGAFSAAGWTDSAGESGTPGTPTTGDQLEANDFDIDVADVTVDAMTLTVVNGGSFFSSKWYSTQAGNFANVTWNSEPAGHGIPAITSALIAGNTVNCNNYAINVGGADLTGLILAGAGWVAGSPSNYVNPEGYTDPGRAVVKTGESYLFAGVSQDGEYPTTEATAEATETATRAEYTDPGVANVRKNEPYKFAGDDKLGDMVVTFVYTVSTEFAPDVGGLVVDFSNRVTTICVRVEEDSSNAVLVNVPTLHADGEFVKLNQGETEYFRSGYNGIGKVTIKSDGTDDDTANCRCYATVYNSMPSQ